MLFDVVCSIGFQLSVAKNRPGIRKKGQQKPEQVSAPALLAHIA
jgi:hypothetical protein